MGWFMVLDPCPGFRKQVAFDQAVQRLCLVVGKSIFEDEVAQFLGKSSEQGALILVSDEFVFDVPRKRFDTATKVYARRTGLTIRAFAGRRWVVAATADVLRLLTMFEPLYEN
jgi:hypothetical protein